MRLTLPSALLLGGLALAGCSTHQVVTPTNREAEGFAPWQEVAPLYRLSPGDRLAVRYIKTPEVDEELPILPDGTVSFRTTGTLRVEGMTTAVLEALIQEKAGAKLLNDPVVSVAVIDPASSVVYVGGQVQRPGSYRLTGRPGTLEALTMAGGFLAEARLNEIILIRRRPDDQPMLRVVDMKSFLEGDPASRDVPLHPGDMIYVPRSPIADTNLWIELFINRLLPFSRSANFNYTRD